MSRHRPSLLEASLGSVAIVVVLTHAPSTPSAEPKSAPPPRNVTVLSQNGVVAADHPMASAVGAAILERGGSAADAGVATLLTLGVVNPFASGLGGGGFCLHRDAKTGVVAALDYREVAPAAASRDMYVVDGEVKSDLSRYGGLAVGVPGEPAGLWALHERYGALPWPALVDPAYQLAARGFLAGELLPQRLRAKDEDMSPLPPFRDAFAPEGDWVAPMEVLRRPDLARTLARLRDQGPEGYYTGPIAEAIVEATKATGGILTAEDLARYEVTWRDPVSGTYREDYTLHSMPPPSSGGVALIEALNILEGFDLGAMGPSPKATHLIVEAFKHAFADRARWLGDADFVDVPVARLTSEAYAKKLRARIEEDETQKKDAYGSTAPPPDDSGTSHISVVDARGNMLSCTSTINTSFGSLVYVEQWGLILNNEMNDFSAQPGVPNAYGLVGNEQNAVAPRKRPLSSMSPTLVLRRGEPYLIAGASGGPTIITGTLLTILRVLDFGLSPTRAVADPRVHHQWLPHKVYLEHGAEALQEGLEEAGHVVDVGRAYNSVQLLVRTGPEQWTAVSDPRKKGRPAGAPPRPPARER